MLRLCIVRDSYHSLSPVECCVWHNTPPWYYYIVKDLYLVQLVKKNGKYSMLLWVSILVVYTLSLYYFRLLLLLFFWRVSPVVWFCSSCVDFVIKEGFFFVCDSSICVMKYYFIRPVIRHC